VVGARDVALLWTDAGSGSIPSSASDRRVSQRFLSAYVDVRTNQSAGRQDGHGTADLPPEQLFAEGRVAKLDSGSERPQPDRSEKARNGTVTWRSRCDRDFQMRTAEISAATNGATE
jgi:hypothetical protein